MPSHEDHILIGKITKKWGFKGQVIILFERFIHQKTTLPESVFIEIQGRLVPFFVETFQKNAQQSAVVQFKDMTDTLLERILNCNVYVDASDYALMKKPAGQTVSSFSGYSVTDTERGSLGIVDHLIERDIQPLLVIHGRGAEILIPFTEEIITRIDHKKKELFISAPDGLLDLNMDQ